LTGVNVLLIRPPSAMVPIHQLRKEIESLSIGYLASVSREKHHHVDILDAYLKRYSVERTVEWISQRRYDVIGFSVISTEFFEATISIIHRLRSLGVHSHITLGGHFPTFTAEQLLKDFVEVDSVISGEGEYTFLELLEAIKACEPLYGIRGLWYREQGNVVANQPRLLIKELDTLPFPARDTLPEVLEMGGALAISSSRGCYGRCAFCSINSFYRLQPGVIWRARSPGNVVDEIEALVEQWRVREIWFVDDNFIGLGKVGRRRAYGIADEILQRGLDIAFRIACRAVDIDKDLFAYLKKAGLKFVFFGVESCVQRTLDTLKKEITVQQNIDALSTLKNLGVKTHTSLIIFDPYTTVEEMKQNLNGLEKIEPLNAYNLDTRLLVFNGIPIKETLEKQGLLRGNYLGYEFAFVDESAATLFRIMRQGLEEIDSLAIEITNRLTDIQSRITRSELGDNDLKERESILEMLRGFINKTVIETIREMIAYVERGKSMKEEDIEAFLGRITEHLHRICVEIRLLLVMGTTLIYRKPLSRATKQGARRKS